jgi:phosphatidylinositol alpha 1,6-mannosyltransferase
MALSQAKSIDRPLDSELRVLICTATYFVLDGVTLTIRRLESHLRSNGVKVKILSTVPDNIDPERVKDVIVIPGIKIPFAHAGEYAFGVGLDAHTIAQIEHFAPNVVHFSVPDLVTLEGIKWCQRNNVAYIGTWHSNYVDYLKYYYIEWIIGSALQRYLRGVYEQIPNVYVPTQYMINKMRDEWRYGTCTELKMWGRGVDMDIFSPARRSETFRRSKGFSNEDIVILWVGRLVPEKRPDIWLNTVKKLQDEGYQVKAMVVGSGSFEKYLSRLKFITCCGWLSGNSLGEAYASSDILLFPSDVETFGNVSLEALSSGCPAIVEKKCGEHLVEDGVNGYTCKADDFEAFYNATKKLVVDRELREKFSKSAREKSFKFERKIILQQMAENYKDAIEKHRDPSLMKRHLESLEGAGVNFLSIICCNFWFLRTFASPFLNSTRVVQDFADNTAECVSLSRSRLSCQSGEWEAALADEELGSPVFGNNGKYERKEKKTWYKGELCMRWYRNCNIPCFGYLCVSKLFRITAFLFSVCLMLCVVYFSFTI